MKLKVSIGLFAAVILLCMCYISSYHHFYGDILQEPEGAGSSSQTLPEQTLPEQTLPEQTIPEKIPAEQILPEQIPAGQVLAEAETAGDSRPASAKGRADMVSDTGCVYCLKLEEGALSVYEADKKTLLERTDITPRNLTAEQEKKYAEGIKVRGVRQLYSALKEFLGEGSGEG